MSEPYLTTHWIDGRHDQGRADRLGDVFDPATGNVQGRVTYASEQDVDRAVRAAERAFPAWCDTTLTARSDILFRFRNLLEEHVEELVYLISSEHGKARIDAQGEVRQAIYVVNFACGLPQLLKGEFSENVATNIDTYSIRQPVGVVAAITPFNFPIMVPAWVFPIAIACGNTFVLKPSEKTPSTSVRVAELWTQAGLPDGVFNVVHGDKVAVDALLVHPVVSAVSSVGSTPVAKYIYETASAHGKRVQALGGAKNHMVVLPDADMDFAADSAVSAGFGSTGQRCMAIAAIVAVGDSGDILVDKIRERTAVLKIGPGTEAESEMGPVVSAEARDRILDCIDRGAREGADVAIDGRDLKVEGFEDGYFVGPTLLDRVTPQMSVYTEEVFGPVLVMVRVDSLAVAIDLINANRWGNGSAIFTSNGGAARTFQHEVQAGMVGVNVPIPVPLPFYSFGGWKDSLFGGSKVYGPEGIGFYTRSKVVTARWPDVTARGVDLGFPGSKRS